MTPFTDWDDVKARHKEDACAWYYVDPRGQTHMIADLERHPNDAGSVRFLYTARRKTPSGGEEYYDFQQRLWDLQPVTPEQLADAKQYANYR